MYKLVAILALISAMIGTPALADVSAPDETVDCFYASNSDNPLCQK